MIDPEKIFNLFSQIDEGETSQKVVGQLMKVQDSPAFKLGMFKKIIFNHLSFNDSLINLVKRVDEDFDVDDVKNASEYIIYTKAWEFIVDFDLKDTESFSILKKYSSQELQASFKLAINFFQEIEEYEKCSHLHQIEKAIQFFLI
jgi:hypothetical protein|tara:strand:- start:299 stop:733 length:435 start_codon:yes stop_codon:yes gene_type:complete